MSEIATTAVTIAKHEGVPDDELISFRLVVLPQRDDASHRLVVQADARAVGGFETDAVLGEHERSDVRGRDCGQDDNVRRGASGGVRAGLQLVQARDRYPLAAIVAFMFRPPFLSDGDR